MQDSRNNPPEQNISAEQAGAFGDRAAAADPVVGPKVGGATGRTESGTLPLPTMEKYFPPVELDSSSETLTAESLLSEFEPLRNDYKRLGLPEGHHKEVLWKWEEENGLGVGACLNVFPSGEITGGCYSLGRRRAPGRRGKLISEEFTKQARKTIRRAVESKVTEFKLFITLTFDSKTATLNDAGQVDQEWAKKEFTRFLNTIKKKYDRLAEKTGKDHRRLSYMWVAEIQEKNTKNIHFHMMVNQPFIKADWLVKIWGQAPNSVNVKRLNNQEHAANYMLKYMKKGNCPIEGKRYGMSQDLVEGAKPVTYRFDGRSKRNAFREVMQGLAWEIEQNGGHVIEWGFQIPAPRRNALWRDRLGAIRTRRGTSAHIGEKLVKQLHEATDAIDKAQDILDETEGNGDEYPF